MRPRTPQRSRGTGLFWRLKKNRAVAITSQSGGRVIPWPA
jgi:hypothetical protein